MQKLQIYFDCVRPWPSGSGSPNISPCELTIKRSIAKIGAQTSTVIISEPGSGLGDPGLNPGFPVVSLS